MSARQVHRKAVFYLDDRDILLQNKVPPELWNSKQTEIGHSKV